VLETLRAFIVSLSIPNASRLEAVNRELQKQIAEREIVVAQLKQSEERFRLLVAGVKDYAIYMLDATGIITTWNAGAERIKGYRAEEIVGKHFSCFFPPDDVRSGKPNRCLMTAALEGKFEEENLRIRKDGSQFWASVLITPLYDAAGRLYGYAKVVRDVTERRENERKLREKERLATLGTTAAVFAHEIGNFLNNLSTSIELTELSLGKAGNLNPIAREAIQAASGEVKRLTSLLKDYRSFARPQGLNLAMANLGTIIEEVVSSLSRNYRASGVLFNLDLREDGPFLADREKMKQVMFNLFKNAFEAMPGGGVITCQVYSATNGVMLEVSDTGTGIAKGVDVFELFQTTKPDGTGLGLPIVEQIVSDHQGTINYTSEIGKGTTFRIWLPSASREAEERNFTAGS
jgi:PAS domain S-box-containing protein